MRPATILAVLACALSAAALVVALTRDAPAPKLRKVVVARTIPLDSAPDKWVDAPCPDGYGAVGGGANVPHGNDTPGVALYWTAPMANGWWAAAQDTARKKKQWILSVVAICLEGVEDDPRFSGALPAETFTGD